MVVGDFSKNFPWVRVRDRLEWTTYEMGGIKGNYLKPWIEQILRKSYLGVIWC